MAKKQQAARILWKNQAFDPGGTIEIGTGSTPVGKRVTRGIVQQRDIRDRILDTEVVRIKDGHGGGVGRGADDCQTKLAGQRGTAKEGMPGEWYVWSVDREKIRPKKS